MVTKKEIRQALAATIRKVLDRHAGAVTELAKAELAKQVNMVAPPGDDAGIALGEKPAAKSMLDKCTDAGCVGDMHKCGEPMVKDEGGLDCPCPNCKHPTPMAVGTHGGSDHYLCPQCTNMFERPQSGGAVSPEIAKEELDKCGDVSAEVPMDKTVVKEHGKFELKTHDGSRTLGTHGTKAGAMRQERAIQAQKHMGKAELFHSVDSSKGCDTCGALPHQECEPDCEDAISEKAKEKSPKAKTTKKGEDYIDPLHENTPGKRLKTVGKDGVLPNAVPAKVVPAPGSGGEIKKSDIKDILKTAVATHLETLKKGDAK